LEQVGVLMHYEAVHSERYFSREKRYSDIAWTSFPAVVDAFRVRFDEWYFEPVRDLRKCSGHHAFGAMVVTCALIDALSQFEGGSDTSKAGIFVNFLEHSFPAAYRAKLKTSIQHLEPGRPTQTLTKVSDVFWYGLRCGLLHQAHAMPYCGVVPGGPAIEEHTTVATKYTTGGDCPTIVFNPWQVFDDTTLVFAAYLADLNNPDAKHNDLRKKFKKKFSDAFGIDITGLT
jgi:hypothetical protein